MNTTIPTAKRPITPAQSAPLKSYLAGAIGTAALLAAPQAEAAVTAVSFSFGPVYDNATDGSGNFSVSGGFGNFNVSGTSSYVHFGWPGVGGGGVYNDGSNYDPYNTGGLMTFFANGTTIGNGMNGPLGVAFPQNDSVPTLNFTSDQLNKNIGFQTSTGNWGWANVSWDATAKAMTFNSAYVESVAGNTITVGDTGISAAPEPSRALLALAGLAGVALRRRRKQEA